MKPQCTAPRARAVAFGLAVLVLAAGCGTTSEAPKASAAPACGGPATATTARAIEPITETPPEPKLPVTYRDFSDIEVTIDDASRILALDTYGTLGATVYALGLGDRLVGRDVSTGVSALRDLPVVTHNGHELNAEAILDLNPSLILTDYSIGPLEVQLQLRDAGIPVVIMADTRGRDQIAPQIRAVAQVLGVPDAGEQLVTRVEGQLKQAQAVVADLAPETPEQRLRMVFLYMRGNAGVYYWFGKESGADDLIEELRGVDVASEVGVEGQVPLNAEGLVKAAPEMYIMMSEGLRSVGGIKGLLEIPGVSDTTAGQRSCVVDMSDYEILSYGPQFPATLEALAHAIYDTAAPAEQP